MSVLNFPWPIDLVLTVASHGWVQLAPWRWDPEAGRLARIERIGDRCGTVEVVRRTSCTVVITWEGLGAADETEILARVRRWLSADWEPALAAGCCGADRARRRADAARFVFLRGFHQDRADDQCQLVGNLPDGGGVSRRAGPGSLSQPPGGARLWLRSICASEASSASAPAR